jgi:DNA-directed RNA polymerase subunit RPC12/RpoP
MASRKIRLRWVVGPPTGHVLDAPTIIASAHSVDYTCGKCGTILLHAEEDQIHGLLIHCKKCGSFNATEA